MSRKDALKNFLKNGNLRPEEEEPVPVEETVEEPVEEVQETEEYVEEEAEETYEEVPEEEPAGEEYMEESEPEGGPAEEEISYKEEEPEDDSPSIEQIMIERTEVLEDTILALRAQVEELQLTLRDFREHPAVPDMSAYVTSREQLKTITKVVENDNALSTNKILVHAMEQIATMREDFFKLCKGMEKKIDSMSARDVLSSFQAYEVDMENILTDGGVFIGHFDYTSLNTIHQRIVEVVPTDDPEKSGLVAERLSDGYKLGNRVLLKEKVSVYKYVQPAARDDDGREAPGGPEDEARIETISETPSETEQETEKSDMEEKE